MAFPFSSTNGVRSLTLASWVTSVGRLSSSCAFASSMEATIKNSSPAEVFLSCASAVAIKNMPSRMSSAALGRKLLFIAQRLDRIQARRFARRIVAKEDSHHHRENGGDHDGNRRNQRRPVERARH